MAVSEIEPCSNGFSHANTLLSSNFGILIAFVVGLCAFYLRKSTLYFTALYLRLGTFTHNRP